VAFTEFHQQSSSSFSVGTQPLC